MSPAPHQSRRRGFTLLESVVAAAAASVLLVGAIAMTRSAGNVGRAVTKRSGMAVAATNAIQRIERDLVVSGFRGEDLNGNRLLDRGEDGNRNLRLDSDWNLADGATATSITMNVVDRGLNWSRPVTYAVANGVLLRTADGATAEICRNVANFTLSRDLNIVTVNLTLSGADGAGETWVCTESRRIHVRN